MTEREIIERQRESGNTRLYLMLVGMFYHAYETAAFVLSELTGYRVIERRRRGNVIVRCLGFPSKQLPRVRERLREKGIELVAEEAPPDLPQGEELVEGFRMKEEGNLYVFTVPADMLSAMENEKMTECKNERMKSSSPRGKATGRRALLGSSTLSLRSSKNGWEGALNRIDMAYVDYRWLREQKVQHRTKVIEQAVFYVLVGIATIQIIFIIAMQFF